MQKPRPTNSAVPENQNSPGTPLSPPPAEQPRSSPEKDKEEDKEKNFLFDTVTTLDKQLTTLHAAFPPRAAVLLFSGHKRPTRDVRARRSPCAVSGEPESDPKPRGERCCRLNSTPFSGSSNLSAPRSARLFDVSSSPPIACRVRVGRVVPTRRALVASMCAKLEQ